MLIRSLLSVLVLVGACAGAGDASADRSGRPFCMFSKHGWTNKVPKNGYVEYITRRATGSDRSGIPQVIERIKQALRIQAQFDVFIAKDENNAFAAVANGRKILVVDVEFLEWINSRAHTEWGAIQVVAHEVGHHIAGFTHESHRNELNADYWSGYVLQHLGSARDASIAAIMAVGTDGDTPSHPNKMRRAEMIEAGWDDARNGQIDYTHCDGCE